MNDITALALLVSKAKASAFTMKYISQFEESDIDSDDVDLRFEVDGVETGTNVSIVDECGQAAMMITALVEALEKAQQRIGELEVIAIDYGMKFQQAQDNLKKMAMMTRDESRTVTVKLPQRLQPGADGYDDWYVHSAEDGEYLKADDVIAALGAAGINVEAE